jgi:quercetin dioxygenase-like cupin family protein
MTRAAAIVPEAGPTLPGRFEVSVRARSEHTNGVLAVIEETLAARAFIRPHTHRNDVWVYVLSGEIGVLVGDEVATAGTGAWALKPRDVGIEFLPGSPWIAELRQRFGLD